MSVQHVDALATEADPVSNTERAVALASNWQAYLIEVARRLRPYFVRLSRGSAPWPTLKACSAP